jgi:hypothetical protein
MEPHTPSSTAAWNRGADGIHASRRPDDEPLCRRGNPCGGGELAALGFVVAEIDGGGNWWVEP